MTSPEPSERLSALAALLFDHRDVLEGRVGDPSAPAWCERRGWTTFLAGLDDAELEAAELDPARLIAGHEETPADLRALAREVLEATRVRPLAPVEAEVISKASASKRAQVAALRAALIEAGHRARRVIDFGAGRGHLTRALAAALDLPAIGLERRPDVVAAARALGEGDGVRFENVDATDERLALTPSDVVVGLHACGALGDEVVRAAAASGAGVLLVPCCPQKVPGQERPPLSRRGAALGLRLERGLLGLANLGALEDGPVSRADALERRRLRYAVRRLLRDAGHDVGHGEESRRINRKRFRGALGPVARQAFAVRGAPPPSEAEIAHVDSVARQEFGRVRRFGLPRTMLARPLELCIAYDRATLLEEAGRRAEVVEAFERAFSPRNLAVLSLGD